MNVMHSEWRDRIRHWMRTLKDDFYEPLGEIAWEAARTMDELTQEEAGELNYVPVEPGYTWGRTWEYCWFRAMITLPREAEGERIVLNLQPDGESTLFVDGKSFGTYRADWIRYPHQFVEDNVLTQCARAGEQFEILMETYAGHYYPDSPERRCATGPVLPGAYTDPLPEGGRRTLGVCTFGIWDEDAYQLFMDVDTLSRLLEILDPASLRAAKVAEALERFTLIVDFEQEKPARRASYREARQALSGVLRAVNGSTMPVFYAIGNAHLDLAWLWPMAETNRKTARTFAAQLRLMEEYPEYKFLQSQPAGYEMCREHYPELFARIKEAVKGGQWIAEGAMWVEPDTNMSGGEALIRQLLYGKRYYKEEFGVDSEILWLPDTFGYTAALPQILKDCGVKYLVTQKIFWSYNEGESFPYHYFWWEGMDGSKITAFLPTDYTYQTDPVQLDSIWKARSQTRNLDAFLLPFGYGDGGGGPARDHIEYAMRQKDLEGSPCVKLAGPKEFFEDMQAQGGPAYTYTGELYFTAHRGTFTSQAKVKQNNRRCEFALRDMEFWGSAALLRGTDYDREEGEALWKELLLHQFHDILPGSGIARIYQESNERVEKVIAAAEEAAKKYKSALVSRTDEGGITLFNSLSFDTTQIVTLPEEFAEGAVYACGGELAEEAVYACGGEFTMERQPEEEIGENNPCKEQRRCGSEEGVSVADLRKPLRIETQVTEQGVRAVVTVPAMGAVSLLPCKGSCGKPSVTVTEEAEGSFVLENAKLRAVINRRGEITSLIHRESGREYCAEPMNRFHFYKDVPRKFDAWDIDSNYTLQEIDGARNVSVRKVQEGIEGILEVRGEIGNSSYAQRISLAAGADRILFSTEVDWRELHRLLKAGFPTTVYATEGINEMQFGYVKHPTHRSRLYDQDRFEVCNHKYSALCDGSHGFAVLNDCKYGISMNGSSLELTLLRAAAAPEMRADQGIHRFTYAIMPWEGSFADSDVIRAGYELNAPLTIVPGITDSVSLFRIDQKNILIDTVKPEEDGSGDLILRLYEGAGAAVTARLSTPQKGVFRECSMLEENWEPGSASSGQIELGFRTFEIRTVRFHSYEG